MGLKARTPDHGGLADLLHEPRDSEGVMGHRGQMDPLSAAAFVLDEPDVASLAGPSGTDIDFAAVATKFEARLAAVAAEATAAAEAAAAAAPPEPVYVQPAAEVAAEDAGAPAAEQAMEEEGQEGDGAAVEAPPPGPPPGPAPSGRLGPRDVVMEAIRGSCEINNGQILCRANFSSVRANVAVFRGRWMYEVQLGSAGILQIGWTPLNARYTAEEGIGDSYNSYAYDGKRVRKWNKDPAPYGERWTAGDVISVGIDLDARTISYWRNGRPMGVAFSNIISRNPHAAYFPGISLSYAERCEVNFGGRPFSFPQEGYSPLQAPPPPEETAQAEFVIGCWERLLLATAKHPVGAESPTAAAAAAAAAAERAVSPAPFEQRKDATASPFSGAASPMEEEEEAQAQAAAEGASSRPIDAMAALGLASSASALIEHEMSSELDIAKSAALDGYVAKEQARIAGTGRAVAAAATTAAALPPTDAVLLAAALAPATSRLVLSDYWVNALIVPLLQRHEVTEGRGTEGPLDRVLRLLCAVLEPQELGPLVSYIADALGRTIRGTIWTLDELPESAALTSLRLWVRCLAHPAWAAAWTSRPEWLPQCEAFLAVRQPPGPDLSAVLPHLEWTEGDDFSSVLAGTTRDGRFAQDVAQVALGMGLLEEVQAGLLAALCCEPANRGVEATAPEDGKWEAEAAAGAGAHPPPALRIFLDWLARKNAGAVRNVPPPGLSPGSVLVSTFFSLLSLLRPWLTRVHTHGAGFTINGVSFLRGGAGDDAGADVPRLGGLLSHLLKEHPVAADPASLALEVPSAPSRPEMRPWPRCLVDLPDGRPVAEAFPPHAPPLGEAARPASVAGMRVDQEGRDTPFFGPLWRPKTAAGAMEGEASTAAAGGGEESSLDWAWWAVEHLLNLYTLGVSMRVRHVFTHINTLEQALSQLQSMGQRLAAERSAHGRELLRLTAAECKKTVEDSLRQHAWHSSWVLQDWKQEGSLALAAVAGRALLRVADRPDQLLAYVQEPYLEAMLEMMNAAKRPEARAWKEAAQVGSAGLDIVLAAGLRVCADTRIVSPEPRSMVLQTLWGMLSEDEFLCVVAANAAAQETLFPALITLFRDQSSWMQAANALGLLVTNWGFQHTIVHPLPSTADEESWARASAAVEAGNACRTVIRSWLAPTLRGDAALASKFFNALFDHVNWTFTELCVHLEELGAVPAGEARAAATAQRRAAGLAEMCIQLLRLQELACEAVPEQILGRGRALNATRLAEILAFGVRQLAPGGKVDTIVQRRGVRPTRDRAQDRRMRSTLTFELLSPYLGAIRALELDAFPDRAAVLPAEPPLAHRSLVPALAAQSLPGDAVEAAFDATASHVDADTVTASAMATGACGGDREAARSKISRFLQYEPTPMDAQEVFTDVADELRRAADGAGGAGEGGGAEGGEGAGEDEPPAEFLDPIMQTVMEDPVVLPNSGITLDRATIERHLLSSATDPFSRAPLAVEDLRVDEALKKRIDAWLAGDRSAATMGTGGASQEVAAMETGDGAAGGGEASTAPMDTDDA